MNKKILIILAAGLLLIIIDLIAGSGTDNIVYRDNDDNVTIVRPDENDRSVHIILIARVDGPDGPYEKEFEISVDPYSANENTGTDKDKSAKTGDKRREETPEETIAYELRDTVNEINTEISSRKVILPSSLSSGEKIYWSTGKKTNTIPIIFITITICLLVTRQNASRIKQLQRSRKSSISRQLPEFVNKLVLLLNAGLVLSSAFEKAVEESLNSVNDDKDYFYGRMREIYINVKETNSPLGTEIRTFARESGDNSLMRISNILSDNISKGVDLTEKLQLESETLWINRKRDCEERGRISETKLTLPLTLFLLVLIIITVSPALLEL